MRLPLVTVKTGRPWKSIILALLTWFELAVMSITLFFLIFTNHISLCSLAFLTPSTIASNIYCDIFQSSRTPLYYNDKLIQTKQDVDSAVAWTLRNYLNDSMKASSMTRLAMTSRTHLVLYEIQRNEEKGDLVSAEVVQYVNELIRPLEKQIYPWLNTTIRQLHNSFKGKGRGIVYTFRKSDSYRAFLSILGLRHIGCQLPIHIMYYGEESLPSPYRKRLEGLPGVTSLDMTNLFLWEHSKPDGFAWKLLSILYAPYEEVMFVDSDVAFFQRPEILFEDHAYHETGTLYFHDRTVFWSGYDIASWMKSFIPELSPYAKALRSSRGLSAHEQESGVLLINKNPSTNVLLGTLISCSMNLLSLRDEVYKQTWGDKETFWIAHEILSKPFAFMPSYGGPLGSLSQIWEPGKAVCGSLNHIGRNERPFWINGGIKINKDSPQAPYIKFDYFLPDNNGTNIVWSRVLNNIIETWCMSQTVSPTGSVAPIPLNQNEIDISNWLVNISRHYESNDEYKKFWNSQY